MNGTLLDWTERIDRVPVPVRAALAATVLAAIVLIDEATGPDLDMTLPYLVVVMAVSWCISRRWGIVTAVLAAVVGWIVNAAATEREEAWFVLVANHALRLASFVLVAVMVASLRQGVARLVDSSRIDPMTGVLNRRGFLDELAAARARAIRQQTPLGVVYLDLDGLKQVNDVEGHAAGDRLIARFAERVALHLRTSDAFGRLGGDEFAIVLERADRDVIDAVVGRVLDDPGLPPASCGVQVFSGDYPPASRMLAGADRRMYSDKRSRRDPSPP
jgi:diguanylate cyclase (GGDEF)-like protein